MGATHLGPRAAVTIDDLVTDDLLARAFAWLCRRRRHFPADADVWDFRRRWPAESARLRAELRAGRIASACCRA